MEALELKAEVRAIKKSQVKQLRRQGVVPAVLYGKETTPVLLQFDHKELQKVLREAGTHQLISLQVGQDAPTLSLAREIQRDALDHSYLHVDFYAVKMGEKLTAQVPLEFVGAAPAVANLGGILTQNLDEVEVECLPSDLVSSIQVNLSGLEHLNDAITVGDLQVPATITILTDADVLVAKIEAPRTAEELEAMDADMGTPAEPEVLKAAKEKTEKSE